MLRGWGGESVALVEILLCNFMLHKAEDVISGDGFSRMKTFPIPPKGSVERAVARP